MHACIAYPLCCSCLSLQACQNGGGKNIFGIGSVNSAQIGDVASDWKFTMTYSNAGQGKTTHVAYTLATSGGTQFTFTGESPPNTYVSWCSSFSMQLYYTSWVYCICLLCDSTKVPCSCVVLIIVCSNTQLHPKIFAKVLQIFEDWLLSFIALQNLAVTGCYITPKSNCGAAPSGGGGGGVEVGWPGLVLISL